MEHLRNKGIKKHTYTMEHLRIKWNKMIPAVQWLNFGDILSQGTNHKHCAALLWVCAMSSEYKSSKPNNEEGIT